MDARTHIHPMPIRTVEAVPCVEAKRRKKVAIINALPPEQKTGRWERYIISLHDGEGCRCSECGFEGVPYWDFCPGCGAKMVEE